VRQVVLLGHSPLLCAGNGVFVYLAEPFGAVQGLGNTVFAMGHLPAVAGHPYTAGILVVNSEVVVDVAVDRIDTHLPSAETNGAHRLSAQGPVRTVEIVDVLLHNVVAAQPGEVIPIAHLPLHIAPPFLLGMDPDGSLVPVDARHGDFADSPVLDALHCLEIAGLMATLRAHPDLEALDFCCFAGLEYAADSRTVNGHR